MPPLRTTSAVSPRSSALTATAHSFNVCLKEPCCEDSKEYTSVEIARQQLYDHMTM
jgi:hypothetical protein